MIVLRTRLGHGTNRTNDGTSSRGVVNNEIGTTQEDFGKYDKAKDFPSAESQSL